MSYALAHYTSPVGRLTLCASDKALVGLWLQGQKYFGGTLLDATMTEIARTANSAAPSGSRSHPILTATREWLDTYFAGQQPAIASLPLAPIGSSFRQRVWQILCQIPYGQFTTYGDIARQVARHMGKPRMSCQAVGGAVGHNPISIIIPCHRVIGAGGNLAGYAGGIATKIRLLALEGVDTSDFFIPKTGTAL